MSLKPQSGSLVPADTQRVAKAVFKKGNPYVTLHDELGPIFDDTNFTELFSKVGQSAIKPSGQEQQPWTLICNRCLYDNNPFPERHHSYYLAAVS